MRSTIFILALAACTSNRDRALKALEVDTDGGPQGPFMFKPPACGYTVAPPDSRGYQDLGEDSTDPIDMTMATPVRVRLGLGGGTSKGDPGYADALHTAVVTWETAGENHAAKIRLGKSMGELSDVRTGYAWATPPPERGLGANENATYMHEVDVCGLDAGTTYFYQVGGGAPGSEVWSPTLSFTTVPDKGPITVGVSGDARYDKLVWQSVQKRMNDAAVAMQIFSGDLVLAGTDENLIASWLDPIVGVTLGQQMVVMVGGNHEGASSQFYGNFAMPGDGPFAETFGSWEVGTVHFVYIDDQRISDSLTGDQAQAQLAWLKADLAKAANDRAAHPFIVCVNHRPQFSTSMHHLEADVIQVRDALVPIFDQYGVDLALGGHDHDYERSKPLKGPGANPVVQTSSTMGTTYVVSAGAGSDPYAPGTDPAPYREKNAAYGAGTPYVGLYTLLKIDGNTLTVTTYGLKPSSTNVMGDDVIDQFVLMR